VLCFASGVSDRCAVLCFASGVSDRCVYCTQVIPLVVPHLSGVSLYIVVLRSVCDFAWILLDTKYQVF